MAADTARVLVWDWTVRVFHWLIVLLIPLMWWTAEEGMMDWHRRMGVTLLGLVIFRLTWGFLGSWTARFIPMLKRISSLPAYVLDLRQGKHQPVFGHGPLGVLSVFALLASLCIQISTGLFSVDVDGLESGPLSVLVSFDTGREFADIHELNFNILSTFITLHVAAILVYQFVLKDNITGPMITGRRPKSDFSVTEQEDNKPPLWAIILGITFAAVSVYAVLNAT